MVVLELRFSAGRYHATPWGRHVNEGAVEWPPSPWRIVRALIATWYLKARRDEEITESTIRALADALSHLPIFRLPPATAAHTRHYMPYNEGKNEKTTKVFDTFIQLSRRDAVLVAWDFDLPPDQFTALHILTERLGYFGRAESLVEARVLEGVTAIESNAMPLAKGMPLPPESELVHLLAPMTSEDYKMWRTGFLEKNSTVETPKKTGGKKTAAKKDKTPKLPDDLFAALHADTSELQAAGWNLPPGALFVNYRRPANAFTPKIRAPHPSSMVKLTVARYAVVSAVSPRITKAISVADRVHKALCRPLVEGRSPATVFTGVGPDGKPLEGHGHAHIFCEANGKRDAITHLTIWSANGFDEEACVVLRRLNKVWGHGGHDLRLVLIGIGHLETFPDCKLFGSSKIWRSVTPFVSTRHAKAFHDGRPKTDATSGWQIGSPEHDLHRLLSLNPKTTDASIQQEKFIDIGELSSMRRLRSLQFQTKRHEGGGRRGHDAGVSFKITFPKEITGPLAFGYGAHFGLGLFVPCSV